MRAHDSVDNGIPWKWTDLAPFPRNTIIYAIFSRRPLLRLQDEKGAKINKIVTFLAPIEPFSSILSPPWLEILGSMVFRGNMGGLGSMYSRNTIIYGTMCIRQSCVAETLLGATVARR